MSQFIEILDKLIIEANKNNLDTNKFSFNCSIDFKNKLKEYKGYPIYYFKLLKKDTIIFNQVFI